MLELYQPWATHEQLMDLLSRLLKELARENHRSIQNFAGRSSPSILPKSGGKA